MPDATPDLIFEIANGFMAAKHLFVANEVGLFAALEESPASLDDLAKRTEVPQRTLRLPWAWLSGRATGTRTALLPPPF
jgi:hypothetical protein